MPFRAEGPGTNPLANTTNRLQGTQSQGAPAAAPRSRESGVSYQDIITKNVDAQRFTPEEQALEKLYWKAVFERYDSDGSGRLNEKELAKLSADHPDMGILISRRAMTSQSLMDQNPYLVDLMRDVQVGDLVFIQGTGVVATATQSEWTHVAICVDKGPPPKFVEAVGMTGGESSRGGVRESDIFQFITDSDLLTTGRPTKFAIVRPSDDPKEIEAAVRFAREQVGKPYDFAFRNGNDGYYCSELIYDAYNHNPYLPCTEDSILGVEKSRARDVLIEGAKFLARGLFGSEENAGRLIERWMVGKKKPRQGSRPPGPPSNHDPRKPSFVSPTDVLNGNKDKIVGTYEPGIFDASHMDPSRH